MIDAYATEPHYLDHLAPIWVNLPDEAKGRFYAPPWIHSGETGITLHPRSGWMRDTPTNLTLVASHRDLNRIRPRQGILLEHGAGQTYGRNEPDHAGGTGRDNAIGFLCPNETVAQANRDAYPHIPAHAVGSPKLDAWKHLPEAHPWTVTIAPHWDDTRYPESRSALPWIRPHLRTLTEHLQAEGIILHGHGHPRLWPPIETTWKQADITPIRPQREALTQTRVHVFDNTSHGFEAAALGHPVILLNPPWYRRETRHGLRFWEWADIGPQIDHLDDLATAIIATVDDGGEGYRRDREAMAEAVFGPLEGAISRAVNVILDFA
jgi:hypothetical protein